MANVRYDHVIAAIDVGTTKICVLIANQLPDQQVEIVGIGKAPSLGLKKGVVVDIAKTVHSIKSAVKEAELMAGFSIESAYVGISGAHIESINSHGVVPIAKQRVRESDIDNALAAAKAIPIAEGHQILHVLPHYFVVDGHDKVHDPRDMHGIRLEVQAHIILGAVASVQNLIKCCEMAGISVADVVLEQLASADAVLSEDERELGVAVLDIGGGTSDLAVYQHGSIRHTKVLPVAGNHFTQDIAVGLRMTVKDAERIKHTHALALDTLMQKDELLEVELIQGEQKGLVRLSDVVGVVNPRARELLSLVYDTVTTHQLQLFMSTGLVLTGGGSLLTGMCEVAQQVFALPVRLGVPQHENALPELLDNPMYATGYGLIKHVIKKERQAAMKNLDGPLTKRLFNRMASWVADFF